MGVEELKKLHIGYSPISQNLESPGDRRRLVYWANNRGHTITTDLNEKVDVTVITENSDFKSPLITRSKVPIIFDLIDAYLSPSTFINDSVRGILKGLDSQISGKFQRYSRHVQDFCSIADVVVCSTVEQKRIIEQYSSNVFDILDIHEEIPFVNFSETKLRGCEYTLIWEGQPVTLHGVEEISAVLEVISKSRVLKLNFVTDVKYLSILNKYMERDTSRYLKRIFKQLNGNIEIIPWTAQNLLKTANESAIAMIPIDLSVPLQNLKPENRLLIMWRLGLPTLTSASPSYMRVSKAANTNVTCETKEIWKSSFERLLDDYDYASNEIGKAQDYLREHHRVDVLLKKWDHVFEIALG